MRKCRILIPLIILFFVCEIDAQNSKRSGELPVQYPDIPRVSAYEAYNLYKAGNLIILHAGGEGYNKRHIAGAFNLDVGDDLKEKIVSRFPKKGIEILTYCY